MNNKEEILNTINSILEVLDIHFSDEEKKLKSKEVLELVGYLNQLFEDYSELDRVDCAKIVRMRFIKMLINLSKSDKNQERVEMYLAYLKNAHKIAGRDYLENFIIYYEWEIPWKDKFYEPRMSILRGYCYYLNELIHKRVEIVIANLPSGAGKTYLEKLGEAFGFGIDDTETILSLCSNDTVVQGGSRTVLNIIKSKEFGEVFPELKYDKEDRDYFKKETAGEWILKNCKLVASYYASTVKSNVVGQRASKLIHIDDLYADWREALDENLNLYYYNNYVTLWRKRFVQGKTPRIVITGTMWSPTDFMVKIIELLSRENKFTMSKIFPYCRVSQDGKKVIIQVPAMDYITGKTTCPELWSTEELERERLSMDDYLWQCNFQQIPVSPQGLQFSYPNLKTYTEKPINKAGYCKGYIDGNRKSGADFFAFPIFMPLTDEASEWALVDAIYTQTATSELHNEIIDKIIEYHITFLLIEENVASGLKEALELKLEQKGINWCEIDYVWNEAKKSTRIERNKGIAKRKIHFPAKHLHPLTTQIGKLMSDFTSYNSGSGARNNHDDAPDSICAFAEYIIEDTISSQQVIPICRPF